MDKIDTTPVGNIPSSIAPMAKIDGGEVRRLRESMGLTQLYLATFIGVTTDTVSRWENRRYPAIKLENAEKLAEALEVGLDAILEHEQTAKSSDLEPCAADSEDLPVIDKTQQPLPPADLVPPAPHQSSSLSWLLLIIFIAILGGLSWWMTRPAPSDMVVSAERILPDHIPAGQTFPVLIRVTTNQQAPVSLIVKEIVPPGCRAVNSEPPATSVDIKSGVLKWINRTEKQELIVAYLLQVPMKESAADGQLRFSGGVTLNQGDQSQANITGDEMMAIAPFHWADVDRNNVIDDEEILAVYDRYSALVQLDFDRDGIDDIWTANGYMLDRKTGKYVVKK